MTKHLAVVAVCLTGALSLAGATLTGAATGGGSTIVTPANFARAESDRYFATFVKSDGLG